VFVAPAFATLKQPIEQATTDLFAVKLALQVRQLLVVNDLHLITPRVVDKTPHVIDMARGALATVRVAFACLGKVAAGLAAVSGRPDDETRAIRVTAVTGLGAGRPLPEWRVQAIDGTRRVVARFSAKHVL
jgi:hypothetical protein